MFRNILNGDIFHIVCFYVIGSGLDVELFDVIGRHGPGSGGMLHKGPKKQIGITHGLGGKQIRAFQHVKQRGEDIFVCRTGGMEDGAFLGKACLVDEFSGFQAVELNPDVLPGIIAVSAVVDDAVGFNEECLALVQLIAGGTVSGAGPVNAFAGKDAVDQIMAAHGRAEGVMGTALLPAVLVDGDVEIVIVEKKVILHRVLLAGDLYHYVCRFGKGAGKRHILV